MKPVSKTAYYCCGVRMQDAESRHPIIGDNYAKQLLGEQGLAYWQEFKQFTNPNASNVARHYIIDQHLHYLLGKEPDSTIILIGAGLDSRAYRFKGGNWLELDEPAVIEYKNNRLPPAGCPNRLTRIAIDFEKEKLADKLNSFAGVQPVIFIVEGVLMYLSRSQKEALIQTLTSLFPKHVLLCDLMTRQFFNRLGHKIHNKLLAHGSSFTDLSSYPASIFTEYGYQLHSYTSTIRKARELGIMRIPKLFTNFLFKKFLEGYSVYHFIYTG
ncbi:class I SAM-dependent methyltransferase [Foetidibacter luteolus]|uniref:class I SAM-dependent methyltransferase n=1 Tax=Foetidibacter luteolus TaxID=2608880 RepID=UPI00129B6920|nr:class I SAM-dependent methyltransferase [Foetidibacter luteolus]